MEIKDIALIITGLITFASVIVKLTPSPKDDGIVLAIRKFWEFLALTPKESQVSYKSPQSDPK